MCYNYFYYSSSYNKLYWNAQSEESSFIQALFESVLCLQDKELSLLPNKLWEFWGAQARLECTWVVWCIHGNNDPRKCWIFPVISVFLANAGKVRSCQNYGSGNDQRNSAKLDFLNLSLQGWALSIQWHIHRDTSHCPSLALDRILAPGIQGCPAALGTLCLGLSSLPGKDFFPKKEWLLSSWARTRA